MKTQVLIVLLGMVACAGCGGDRGPTRYPVQGSVTYAGKPVPAGQIAFEPDARKGNLGPASYAEIKAGQYATPDGKGAIGGPHIVRILGSDGNATQEIPNGKMLFSEFQATLDLPREAVTRNFDVPASQ